MTYKNINSYFMFVVIVVMFKNVRYLCPTTMYILEVSNFI